MFYEINISLKKSSQFVQISELKKFESISKKIVFVLFILLSSHVFAQKNLQQGNKEFKEQKYADAEANYRIEKSKAENKSKATYNLANSIYRQKAYAESKLAYSETIEKSTDKSEKHKAYHNLGNVLMQEKNYQAAVEAYKNALRNNPYDEQTRYNYALAKEMLDKNPPPPDQNQDDQNQDNQDENQKDQNKENQKGNEIRKTKTTKIIRTTKIKIRIKEIIRISKISKEKAIKTNSPKKIREECQNSELKTCLMQ